MEGYCSTGQGPQRAVVPMEEEEEEEEELFRQTPQNDSGVSASHHQEVHRIDTTIGTYSF
jgi:hypothetical protein